MKSALTVDERQMTEDGQDSKALVCGLVEVATSAERR
jgi:hypothetical protein